MRFSFDFHKKKFPYDSSKLKNWFDGGGDPEKRFFRVLIACSVGVVVLMVVIGLITFVLSLKRNEQTMVPDVSGMELPNAMIELQDKALYPVLQLVQSNKQGDKGIVLGQDPGPGTLVKVGSRVVIKVSRGEVIEKLENYVGWNIDDLETHLSTLVSVYGPLLRISKPVIRVYHDSAPGTIIEQKPAPGTELTSLTDLVLVVSKGPEGATFAVKNYVGMRYTKALSELASDEIPFLITSKPAGRGEKAGVIVSQTPNADALVPVGTLLQLTMTEPDDVPADSVFGFIQKTLPKYPVPVDLQIEAIAPSGAKRILLSMKHSGGVLTFPYVEEKDSSIIVSVNGTEVFREQARKK
ncbi:MAG TPA: PASTA domain-containing protein [Spirochaetia bacterium]|nr:PASTA domain-containing protein [Spirochaetia bacterium]